MIQYSITKKTFKIFTKEEKLFFFFIILIQFFTVFLELLSIGSLLPIFKSLTDPSWNEKYLFFIDADYRIIAIFTAVIILFLLKNLFIIGSSYITKKFQNKVNLRIIREVYDSYLNKKYEFHINNHSSILLRNMEYFDSFDGIFMRLVNFYSDTAFAVFAFLAVFFINIKFTIISVSALLLILILYGFFTRMTISKYGSETQSFHTLYKKNMMEGIKSYKEILLSGKQKFFSDRNKKYKDQALKYSLKFTIIELIPKHLLELSFVFFALAAAYYVVVFENLDLNEYLPLIGVIVIGLLKFLPRILSIFSSYQHFKYLLPVIDIINDNYTNLKKDIAYELENEFDKQITFKNSIELKNVSFKYSDKTILDNLNLLIKKKSVLGIKGESGTGKSTILNILTGLISPTSGKILVDNQETNFSTKLWQTKIGYVSQNTHLLDDTIKTNIAFGSDTLWIDQELLNDCIKKSGLEKFINSLKDGVDTVVGENGTKVSGGQIQRIGIARAFYKKPEILILDEPTNSLDKENENKIIETLKNLKNEITMVLVSHNEEPLKIADEKIILDKGRIID